MRMLSALFILFLSTIAQATCINENAVELKAKPEANSKTTWVVPKYMPVVEVGRKGAWIQIADVDNTKHWVHARNLTSKFNCIIVKSDMANLRLGAGTQYPLTPLSYVRKYSAFQKLDRDEEWVKVRDEFGGIHWLHENTIWEPRTRTKVSFQ